MPDAPEPRGPCPVCLGVLMEKVKLRDGLVLDHCARCGGIWFDADEVQRLRTRPRRDLWQRVKTGLPSTAPCHGCHTPIYRDAERCAGCGRHNRLECPGCRRLMRRYERGGVVIDRCEQCQSIWLDRAELAAVWSTAFMTTAAAAARGGEVSPWLDLPGDAALELVVRSPELAWHVGTSVGDLVAAAPDVAVAVGEGLLELAGHAFTLVLEILVGLLDGL